MKFYMLASVAALAIMPVAAQAAVSINYTTNANQYDALGDSIGSTFDQINLASNTGVFTGAGTYLLNKVTFTVGYNCNTCGYTQTGTLTNGGTSSIGAFTYVIPYSIAIGNSADSITLGGNSIISNGYKFTLNSLTLTGGAGQVFGDLTATAVAVPEPAAWAMLMFGFATAGGALRRRQQPVRVKFA